MPPWTLPVKCLLCCQGKLMRDKGRLPLVHRAYQQNYGHPAQTDHVNST